MGVDSQCLIKELTEETLATTFFELEITRTSRSVWNPYPFRVLSNAVLFLRTRLLFYGDLYQ